MSGTFLAIWVVFVGGAWGEASIRDEAVVRSYGSISRKPKPSAIILPRHDFLVYHKGTGHLFFIHEVAHAVLGDAIGAEENSQGAVG